MNKLKRLALRSETWHEFLAEVIRWIKWHGRKYPEIKLWKKNDLKDFYIKTKEGSYGLPKAVKKHI